MFSYNNTCSSKKMQKANFKKKKLQKGKVQARMRERDPRPLKVMGTLKYAVDVYSLSHDFRKETLVD